MVEHGSSKLIGYDVIWSIPGVSMSRIVSTVEEAVIEIRSHLNELNKSGECVQIKPIFQEDIHK